MADIATVARSGADQCRELEDDRRDFVAGRGTTDEEGSQMAYSDRAFGTAGAPPRDGRGDADHRAVSGL